MVILIPAILLLFVVYQDYHNLSALGRSAELILSKNYRSIKAAQNVRQLLEANRNHVLMHVFHKTNVPLEFKTKDEITRLLGICRTNITEPGETQIVEELFEKYSRYATLFDQFSRGAPPDGPDDRYYDFISVTADLISRINDLVVANEHGMEVAEQETKRLSAHALRFSMGLLTAAIVFILTVGFFLSWRITKPLRLLAGMLAEVREGSGQYPRIPVTTQDEIGFLTSEFNRLFERLEVYDLISADKLSAEKDKVRLAEEAKARFIADLSHQLKTPMTSLAMGIGIMSNPNNNLNPENREKLITMAREDCARLSALINELVDIARLEGMVKPREKELLNVAEVIDECLRPLRYQGDERGVHLEADVEPGLPPVAMDSLRFPWVITNLAGNAIRYTERGGSVTIRVRREHNHLTFQCIDTGAGIDPQYLPKIFDRFSQFSERGKSGTIGLGLAIVREIIEQHGGNIEVTSELGKGTIFTFRIPLHYEDGHAQDTAD